MEEKIRQGYLYDFYGELLNDHQRSIFEAYVLEDLSLAEVAEAQGISRQGVHDLIRRCTKTLEDYESRLHLIDKFMHIRDKVDEIRTLTQQDVTDASMSKIESIASEILEEL
ncbi:MAG: YlxM family DNA-binding protein [Lachnospiraceae bacterium]|nr:YlxM family DNA-binding protein [Lachnospiraceae bacterium]